MSRHLDTDRDTAVVGTMRVILWLAAVLVFLAGFQLTVFAERTDEWFAWTIDVPMTAAFLGASYWSSAVLEVVGARSPGWGRARLAVWTVLVFTTLTLVATLIHGHKFHFDDDPTSARVIAWGWLAIYAGVPVAMVVGLVLQARSRTALPGGVRRPLPRLLRWLLVALAVALAVPGAVLYVDPDGAANRWAWPLTPLTAMAVGAWLIGLGWAAAHARLIDDADEVWPLGLTGVAFVVLQAIALARYGDALDGSGEWQTVAYLAGLAWIGVVSVWILALRPRQPRRA
jgi:hypothetical protein